MAGFLYSHLFWNKAIGLSVGISMSKETISVTLHGCDDSTTVNIEASLSDIAFLERLETALRDAADYECMPRMSRGPKMCECGMAYTHEAHEHDEDE